MAVVLLLAAVFVFTLVLAGCESALKLDENLQPNIIDDNYRTFYEIFVGGFSDSDGNGMGDLQGVVDRLDYLNDGDPTSGKSLGIGGIWLMPIMPSPSYHKYDVIDYRTIDSDYGSMEDMRLLVSEAHKRGIKVIIDLVLNHTSTSCDWFVQARNARRTGDTSNPYYDYYSVSTTKSGGWDDFATDPTGTKWYYEGNFSSEMPELNWDNPAVRTEIEGIVDFWLSDVGIDGFRLDAVRYYYMNDTTRNVQALSWFRDYCRSVLPDVYIVGEAWDNTQTEYNYAAGVDVFNFGMGGNVTMALQSGNASLFASSLVSYCNNIRANRADAIPQPFLSNHDQDRIGGSAIFYGRDVTYTDTLKQAATLYLLSPGSPFIYYGEEIGMKGSRSASDGTDANRRLAMLWGDGDKVRDPIGTTYSRSNQSNGTVKQQLKDKDSLLNHYKLLIAIRNANPEIARGTVENVRLGLSSGVCCLKFTYNGSVVYVLHNVGSSAATVDVSSLGISVLRAVAGESPCDLSGSTLSLGGHSSVVLK